MRGEGSRRRRRGLATLANGLLLAALAAPAGAAIIVTLVPSSTTVALAGSVDIELRASLPDPLVGFGLDLVFDPLLLATLGPPVIGPLFVPLAAPHGDGPAGASGLPPSGTGVLLATVTFTGVAP